MNPELEALIRAYDEFLNAEKTTPERDQLWENYQKLLISSADRERVSSDILHKAVQQRHFLWLTAQNRPSSLPPKA